MIDLEWNAEEVKPDIMEFIVKVTTPADLGLIEKCREHDKLVRVWDSSPMEAYDFSFKCPECLKEEMEEDAKS